MQQRAATALAHTETEVAVRRLPTADLPGIYVGRGGVAVTLGSNSRANYLVLNWDNKVIRALAEIPDDIVFERVVTVLYVQARMAGNADTPTDRQLLVGALDDIIALAVGVPD